MHKHLSYVFFSLRLCARSAEVIDPFPLTGTWERSFAPVLVRIPFLKTALKHRKTRCFAYFGEISHLLDDGIAVHGLGYACDGLPTLPVGEKAIIGRVQT